MERVKRVTVPAWIHARSRRPGLCMPGALRREPPRSTCPIGMELFRVPASCAAHGKGSFGWRPGQGLPARKSIAPPGNRNRTPGDAAWQAASKQSLITLVIVILIHCQVPNLTLVLIPLIIVYHVSTHSPYQSQVLAPITKFTLPTR